jgi:hypothetical protein
MRIGLSAHVAGTAVQPLSATGKGVIEMASKGGGNTIGRSAITGQFVPVKVATTKASTHVVTTLPKPTKGK